MENTFGSFLNLKRKEKNLTQKQLAEKLFVTESAVSKWEKNKAHPDITLLPKLAEILNVSEHELITASTDENNITLNKEAKKWRTIASTWEWFFYILYSISLLTCFIVNIAVNKTLSWFWIVLSAILLSASFTTFPKFIKKYRLLIISLGELVLLILLLGICCLSTHGNWFWVTVLPILFLFIIIFVPIFIKQYKLPTFIKKNSALFCIILDFIMLTVLLFSINQYTNGIWFLFAFKLSIIGLMFALIIAFLYSYTKINKLIKVGILLMVTEITLLIYNTVMSKMLYQTFGINYNNNIIPNLTQWQGDMVGNNVIFIIHATITVLAIIFIIFGIKKHLLNNKYLKSKQ